MSYGALVITLKKKKNVNAPNLSEFVFSDPANSFPNLLQGIYFRIINVMQFAWKEV